MPNTGTQRVTCNGNDSDVVWLLSQYLMCLLSWASTVKLALTAEFPMAVGVFFLVVPLRVGGPA